MLNWTLPTITSLYEALLNTLKLRDEQNGKMNYEGDTSIPIGFIQYSRTNRRWEEWNGSTWDALEDMYSISVASAFNADVLNQKSPAYYLDCTNFTGILSTSRIPSLSATKITSGTLSSSRVPNLSASKIDSGTLSHSRLYMPSIVADAKFITAVNSLINARYSTSSTTLDIDTSK